MRDPGRAQQIMREEAAKSSQPEIAEYYKDQIRKDQETDEIVAHVRRSRGLAHWDDDEEV